MITRYFKVIESGKIVSVGMGTGGTEIDHEEYADIVAAIRALPKPNDDWVYTLNEDLTVCREPNPDPATMDENDRYAYAGRILLGVEE